MSEEKRYRVWNNKDYAITVKFDDGVERRLPPHTFFPMTRMQIDYLSAISSVFSTNRLTIDDPEEAKAILEDNGIVTEGNAYFDTDEDLRKHLRASATNVAKWLEGIEDRVLLIHIKRVAVEMDLASSKMKLIDAKLNDEE